MHRELNPKLFSEGPVDLGDSQPGEFGFPLNNYRSMAVPESFIEQPARTLPYAPVDIPAMESRVDQLAGGVRNLEHRNEVMVAKMEELARSIREHLKEVHHAMSKLDERQRQSEQINETRASRLLAKIGESHTDEGKIQELIDRQNMAIRSFENRVLAMQRVISQQEAALHMSEAALNDARNEILKLKR